MKFFLSCCFLALHIPRILSITISRPRMQRKIQGESCIFQWNINGNFTTYTIQNFSTGSPSALGPNTNHTFYSRTNVISLWIWNIQQADAGNYSLSITTGTSTEENSAALLFVYTSPYTPITLTVGRNPAFEGDTIELYCSAVSRSLPAAFQPKMYYQWYTGLYSYLRNISSGPALLQNGDVLPGYSIKNDGKTLVINSVLYADYFYCFYQEEGSPYKVASYYNLQLYSKPYISFFTPASKICNAALSSYTSCYFYFVAIFPLTSYTNWSFINASGGTTELPLTLSSNASGYVNLYFQLFSSNSYGNYSVTLTNSYGSRTGTFQVLPQGPPDVPSSFSVQYVTHSLVSLQWRCMWFNGVQQTVFVRLMDVTNNAEVETQTVPLATNCYNSAYSTLFQNDIRPETDYEASIWSINTLGSSNVVTLAIRTPKILTFDTSSANISIIETQAIISFRITDSTKAILGLNVICCVELTTLCSNKSYIITNTDNQIVYDILPTGSEYVFDFNVYDGDGYTYVYTMAILKGVRVSRTKGITSVTAGPTTYIAHTTTTIPNGEKGNQLLVAVIVLAVLLGVAVLALIGCLIGFLVCKCHRNNSYKQESATARPSVPSNSKPDVRESSEYVNARDFYKPAVDLNPSKANAY